MKVTIIVERKYNKEYIKEIKKVFHEEDTHARCSSCRYWYDAEIHEMCAEINK